MESLCSTLIQNTDFFHVDYKRCSRLRRTLQTSNSLKWTLDFNMFYSSTRQKMLQREVNLPYFNVKVKFLTHRGVDTDLILPNNVVSSGLISTDIKFNNIK